MKSPLGLKAAAAIFVLTELGQQQNKRTGAFMSRIGNEGLI